MNQESWHAGFLAKLAPRFRMKLLSLAHSFRYSAGTTIFREGDPSLYFYLVKSGRVALDIAVPAKGTVCLLTVEPGDIFSWSALLESHAEMRAKCEGLEPASRWASVSGTGEECSALQFAAQDTLRRADLPGCRCKWRHSLG